MRHHKFTFKIGRSSAHVRALLANAVCSLIEHGRITTTLVKAKRIRQVADQMVTYGQEGTLSSRRLAIAKLHQVDKVRKLFSEIAPGFAKRAGGYTRLIKMGPRIGDGAEMAIVEFVENDETVAARKMSKTTQIVLLILLGDLAAVLIYLGVRAVLLIFKVENFYYRLVRRYPDNRIRADECYRRVIKQLGFLGLEMAPSDTIVSFSRRGDELLGSEPGHEPMEKAFQPVILSRFAMRKPSDGEVKRMCDFYIYLEKELRKKLGFKNYILHRMLLGR